MTKVNKPRGPRLTVSVTREIIERSTPRNSKTCMIAEAIKEAFPEARTVSVDLQTCRFTDHRKGLRYIYLTPRTGQKPLLDFDQGILPEPFEMVLKNAHVTRARGTKKAKTATGDDGLSKKSTRLNQDFSVSPVGGRAPAQMRTVRKFGIKAFQGFADPVAPTSNTTVA